MIKPEAIFFDWDGTLADSYYFLETAHNAVRDDFGLPPLEAGEFKNYFGQPRETLYPIIYGPENVEEAKRRFGDYIVKNQGNGVKIIPGAEELVKACHEMGIIMGVISNKKAEFLHIEIRNFGWGGYFKVVLGAGDAAHDKPAADPLLKAISACGIKSMENVWYAGDTDVDLKCAENAGVKAVFIAHDSRSDEWIKNHKPFLILRNCRELQEFLLQNQ